MNAPARLPASCPASAPASADPIGPNLALLRRTLELVEALSDAQYTHVERRLTSASIGAHVRHVLEHYRLFLEGLAEGEVDYDARERDTDVERSAGAAADEARRLIAGFAMLRGATSTGSTDWAARPLRVRQQGTVVLDPSEEQPSTPAPRLRARPAGASGMPAPGEHELNDEALCQLDNRDTASIAAVAAASTEFGPTCDPERLNVFWSWWLREALPAAVDAARRGQAV